jgi:hypothetical protein
VRLCASTWRGFQGEIAHAEASNVTVGALLFLEKHLMPRFSTSCLLAA